MPKAKKKTSTAKSKKATPKAAKKTTAKKTVAKKAPAKKAAKKTVAKKAPAKKTAKKTVAKKAPAKKTAVKKTPAKKAVKKTASKKAPANKAVKKTASKKAGTASTGSSDTLLFKGFQPYKIQKNEDYMNEEHVSHFRNLLNLWKHELMEEVDKTVHHMQDEAANFPDPNDRATQESEFSLELRARDRERKLIKKIDEAVVNLDNEEYGYCESCGVEIGIRRLEARPTATLCIDCKTLDEIREKQMG